MKKKNDETTDLILEGTEAVLSLPEIRNGIKARNYDPGQESAFNFLTTLSTARYQKFIRMVEARREELEIRKRRSLKG